MKRSRKKALLITGVLIALPALFIVEEHFRGKHALTKLKRELTAKGEKLTIDECRVPVPDGADNGYPELLRAVAVFPGGQAAQVAPGSMRAVAPGKVQSVSNLSVWASPYATGKNPPLTNTWETLASALDLGADQLAVIRELLRKPLFIPTINYHQGFSVPMPHLVRMKIMAQHLCTDALLQIHQGHNDAAVEDIIAQLRLGNTMREERFVISQLVRFAIDGLAVGPTWQTLQAPGVTDAQLARLQDAWRTHQYLPDMMQALGMERAVACAQYAHFRASPGSASDAMDAWTSWGGMSAGGSTSSSSFDDVMQSITDKGGSLLKRGVFVPLWQFAWSHEDERAYVATLQAMIDGARESHRQYSMHPAFRTREALNKSMEEQNPYNRTRRLLSSLMVPALFRTIDRAALGEAQRDLVVTAIALKRHELRHGRLPAELNALLPEFLPALPRDIIDGQPLRYRLREGGGFLLYSIGNNEKDDGGDAKPPSGNSYYWGNGRDLVWPQPATAEEIEAADNKTKGAVRTAPWPKK